MSEVASGGLDRFVWMEAVLASGDLSHAQKNVLIRLALHLNIKTALCNPSVETVAYETGLEPRSARAAFEAGERFRFLRRVNGQGGRGRSNSFLFVRWTKQEIGMRGKTKLFRYDPAQSAETRHGDAGFEDATRQDQVANEASPREKPGIHVPPNRNEYTGTGFFLSESDCAAALFDEFWKQYPKKRAKAAARKAYIRAIKNGANSDELLTGAMRYAAERMDQEERYTKDPANWLKDECWHDQPVKHRKTLIQAADELVDAALRNASAGAAADEERTRGRKREAQARADREAERARAAPQWPPIAAKLRDRLPAGTFDGAFAKAGLGAFNNGVLEIVVQYGALDIAKTARARIGPWVAAIYPSVTSVVFVEVARDEAAA
jgi:hypothetical protein